MKFLANLDLTGLEIQNVRAQNLGAAPAAPLEGRFYYDSATKKIVYWNGTAWINTDGSSIPDNTITSAKIVDGAILNVDINNAAGIALSKLATDPLARGNHTGTQAAASISDFNTARDLQRLDQHAAPTAAVALGNQKITGLGAGTANTDAVNFLQLQDAKHQIDRKDSVRVATTVDVNLASPGANLDGIAMAVGESFLATGQTTGSQNGIYVWNGATVAATRRVDADSNAEVTAGLTTVVEEGTQADRRAILATNNPIVLGTTALVFTFESTGESITGGAGLTKTGGTLDVGQGTGIIVSADAIAIDTVVVTRKVTATLGDGAALAYVVAHNLGNQWVDPTVVRNSAPFDVVGADIELTSVNTVTVRFAVAPTAAQFRVIVTG